MSDADRREFLRIPVTTKVKFKKEGDGEDQVLFTDNLSEGGLFLNSDNPPFVGTIVHLEISIPNVDKLINLKGEVTWRLETKGCGVRFMKVTQVQKKMIKIFVDSLQANESSSS